MQHNVQFWGETLRLLVELSATAAFALSGILEAARKRLDAVDVVVVVVGFLAAFGGGTLRDLLLDQRPFFWVRHVEMLWGVLALYVLVAALMGLITGVFFGVLRDMACNQILNAFRDHRPYAVCAFAGGWVYVGLWQIEAPGWLALLACVDVTTALRGRPCGGTGSCRRRRSDQTFSITSAMPWPTPMHMVHSA